MSAGRDVNLELARYRRMPEYVPTVGDFIIKVGWFYTEYAIVNGLISGTVISAVFSGVPFTLCTYTEAEISKNTRELHISDLQRSKPGKYSVLQSDPETGVLIVYI